MLGFSTAVGRFFEESGFFLAAGLAFCFLVCVIPLTLLGVSTLGFVLSTEQAEQEVVGQLARNFPVYRREIAALLLHVIDTRAVSGVAGLLILVFFSTPLFGASRLVLHRMLGVKADVGWVRNFIVDAGLVLVLTVLLFIASSVTWLFQWSQDFLLPVETRRRWIGFTTLGFSVTLSAVMFYLGYRYVPRRRPRLVPTLAGAVLAAVLWEVAKQVFRLYIRQLAVYDQIYGPFGFLIAFVMFVYYSAIVFVFGAAYVASLDSRRK